MPIEDSWFDFLHYMRWTDEEVLDRQPDDYVTFEFERYQLKCEFGLLTQGQGLF